MRLKPVRRALTGRGFRNSVAVALACQTDDRFAHRSERKALLTDLPEAFGNLDRFGVTGLSG